MRIPLALACVLAACSSDRRDPAPVGPDARGLAVRTNETNVLSAFVTFESADLVSARVQVEGGGEESETPLVTLTDGPQEILVLGLLPETEYRLVLLATGSGGERLELPPLTHRTPALPEFFRTQAEIRAVGTSSGGYTLTNFLGPDASRHYIFAFDDRGRVRWYRHLPGMGAYAEQLPNGNYGTFMGFTTGFQNDPDGHFLELTPAGDTVARHQATAPYITDNHELLLTPAAGGGWTTHYFTYDIRVTDTTRIGGGPNTNLAGHQIVRLAPDGTREFFWDAWDHFQIEDWIEEPAIERTRPDGDFDHPNSLTFDHDGNYIVSWRNMAEITKIDARSGAIIYRFGGRNNQFRILGDPLYDANGQGFAFCGQHSVQVLADGNLLLFDNGLRHSPRQSRAVE
jgi:hypothetical protein